MNIIDKIYIKSKKYVGETSLDTNDCGPACLCTILKYYGIKTTVARISELALTDVNGTTAIGVIKAAEHYNLNSKAFKVKLKESQEKDYQELALKAICSIQTPFIAHFKYQDGIRHYIVVYEVLNKKILIYDPSEGFKMYSQERFLDNWTGLVLTFMPKEDDIKHVESSKTDFFKPIIFRQKPIMISVFFLSLAITLFGIGCSLYYEELIDRIIPNNMLSLFRVITLTVILMAILKITFEFCRNMLISSFARRIDGEMFKGYFEHIIDLPIHFFESKDVGSIMSRFQDAIKIRIAISSATITVGVDCIMCFIGGIILCRLNNNLFLYCLIPFFLYLIICIIFAPVLGKRNKDIMYKNSNMNAQFVEAIEGMSIIKAFNAETAFLRKINTLFDAYTEAAWKSEKSENLLIFFKSFVKGVFEIVILALGAKMTINGNATIGEVIAFNALLIYFLIPIEGIINLQPQIQNALVAAKRFQQVIDLQLEVDKNENLIENPIFYDGSIEFKDVSFRYGYRRIILKDMNLKIGNKELVAVVGASGVGKSTIAKALMRLYDIESGEILIGGVNIKNISQKTLREKIAYVSQQNYFFSGSIRQNLKMWNDSLSDTNMIELCKRVNIHDDIMHLSKGYDEIMAEKGANFSGGQLQRLAIVRALMRNPMILILDEATSNLDSITENSIEKLLNDITENMTVIKIAHRLSTVKKANRICVIDEGHIVEEGVHSELLAIQGVYYNLWKNQMYD